MDKTIRNVDWILLACLVALAMIGSVAPILQDDPQILRKYIAFWVIGMLGFTALCFVPLKNLERASLPIYAATLLFLDLAFFMADVHWGARRWIDLGAVKLQPAELMKWALIVALAGWFACREAKGKLTISVSFLLAMLPATIIFMQPDFGLFLAIVIISYIMIIAAGLSRRLIFLTLAGAAATMTLLWNLMYEYQKVRISALFDPQLAIEYGLQHVLPFNLLANAYDRFPKLVPFDTGGLFDLGKVSMQPVESVLRWGDGLVGVIAFTLAISVYALLLSRILMIRYRSRDRFARILATGIATLFTFNVVANVGMAFSFFPVLTTLAPLPFIGSDGAALISMVAAMGLVMRIAIESNVSSENTEESPELDETTIRLNI